MQIPACSENISQSAGNQALNKHHICFSNITHATGCPKVPFAKCLALKFSNIGLTKVDPGNVFYIFVRYITSRMDV